MVRKICCIYWVFRVVLNSHACLITSQTSTWCSFSRFMAHPNWCSFTLVVTKSTQSVQRCCLNQISLVILLTCRLFYCQTELKCNLVTTCFGARISWDASRWTLNARVQVKQESTTKSASSTEHADATSNTTTLAFRLPSRATVKVSCIITCFVIGVHC